MHKVSNLKFSFIIGPFVVKTRACLPRIKEKLKEFVFSQLQGKIYDPHQFIYKRRLMNKQGPYEHEYVEGFDKLANLQTCADMEAILQPVQTQQVGPTLQQTQTQQTPQTLKFQVPKVIVYTKRSSS